MPGMHIVTLTILLAAMGIAVGPFAAPGDAQTRPLPPDHPAVGGSGPRQATPAPAGDSGTGDRLLTWTSPVAWTKETPSSPMRRAQYRIPGPGGPGECVVFYFGPGEGGDAKSNVARWASQFRRADGSPVGDALKTREITVGKIPVVVVEVTGTYIGGMGGGPEGPERPKYMLLGAIAEGPDARWFFRATGPQATLETQRAAFDRLIRSIKQGP